MSLTRRAAAEGVGTFGFVFLACASTVANVYPTGRFDTIGIALAHAAALGIFVAGTLGISGCHLNPAVTLGFLSTKRIDGRTAAGYIVAQLIGAILAAYALKFAYPPNVTAISPLGTPALATTIGFGRGIALEALGTFMLMSTVCSTIVGRERPALAGFGVGVVLLAIILAIGPATGAAVNPARALGPAVASGNMIGQAIYWIGPILGAVIAAQLWERVLLKK